MSRIPTPATIDAAPAASQPLLEAVKKQLGVVPNLFRLVANSPAALEGYLGLSGALNKGSAAGADARAHRARRRRDQRLQLLPVGPHLSRQEPRQARRCRDRRQPQRRLERPQGRRGRALRRQGRARARAMSARTIVGAVKAAGYDDATGDRDRAARRAQHLDQLHQRGRQDRHRLSRRRRPQRGLTGERNRCDASELRP